MYKKIFPIHFIAWVLIISQTIGQNSYQSDFSSNEFKQRWQRIYDEIGDKGIAIIQGFPQPNGFIYPRQTNVFYYLSGIETPHSYLLLDGRKQRSTLYLPPPDKKLEKIEGKILSVENASLVMKLVGVDQVRSTEDMKTNFPPNVERNHIIYTLFSPAEGQGQSRYELQKANAAIARDYWDGRMSRESRLVELLRNRFPRVEIKDLTPIIDNLRSIKSPKEVSLIRRASQLAGLAMMEAIRSSEEGVWEYQLDGVARYIFLINDAKMEAYRSITASGVENISNGHYYRNNSMLKDGDLVLMDYAPDFKYYVSDIARMWPVSGTYTPEQRELLQIILEYRNTVLDILRPGITPEQVLDEAEEKMEPVMRKYKFSKNIYRKAAEKMIKTGGGVLSHPVGLAVHDNGTYKNGTLKVGHVFAVDPQLWVPEENLYLRYEDTVVITEEGNENFTDFLPAELNELEDLVKENGILQTVGPDSMRWDY